RAVEAGTGGRGDPSRNPLEQARDHLWVRAAVRLLDGQLLQAGRAVPGSVQPAHACPRPGTEGRRLRSEQTHEDRLEPFSLRCSPRSVDPAKIWAKRPAVAATQK